MGAVLLVARRGWSCVCNVCVRMGGAAPHLVAASCLWAMEIWVVNCGWHLVRCPLCMFIVYVWRSTSMFMYLVLASLVKI
jgi:hypothetical protein